MITDERLREIEARAAGAKDVPELVAEVRRLRAILTSHAYHGGIGNDRCIGCGSSGNTGEPHDLDCEIAAILGIRRKG